MSAAKSRSLAPILNKVLQVITQVAQKKVSGELRLQRGDRRWSVAFYKGKIAFATDNHHRVRRWQRIMRQHEVQFVPVGSGISPQSFLWEYHWLGLGLEAGEIAPDKIQGMIEAALWEVLVVAVGYADASLRWHKATDEELQYLSQHSNVYLPFQSLEPLAKKVLKDHQRLNSLEITVESLDMAPVFKDPNWGAKSSGSGNTTYLGLVPLLNGRRSTLDVMVTMRQPLAIVAHIMRHLIRKEAVEFRPLGDRPVTSLPPFAPNAQAPSEQASSAASARATESKGSTASSDTVGNTATHNATSAQPLVSAQASVATLDSQPQRSDNKIPLVACVDDSPQVCAIMESIVKQSGYRYVSTQDSVKAVSLLLQHQPDLIFLDLIMPIVNGYEVCKQLKRVKRFKKVPIAILTGNDGAIDRVRAKVVGASDFIAKPVQQERIVAVLRRHFATSKVPADRAAKAALEANGFQVKVPPSPSLNPTGTLRELGGPLMGFNGEAATG